jgi:bla regulator protein blaR1
MNPSSFSSAWSALVPAIGNHLWQSTIFAIAVTALTLILRNNRARDRYWLWLVASLKFLIPFSPLIAIGTYLARSRGSATSSADFSLIVEQVSQPFTLPTASGSHDLHAALLPTASHFLPMVFATIWLGGFITVLALWFTNWRRLSNALRNSVPLLEGPEVEALRRQERVAGIRQRVEMLLSCATLEPGIFGMTRPVLMWPEGISQHLEAPHLEAIVAHELWHVRRRDNFAAVLHMIVEAIFWFHPLVWWLGARLVEERERACDEEVVGLGGERRIYAESILKVCEFCVGSPLACVSGVTGSDLKKRMVHIMSEHVAQKLDFTKKLLLTVAGVLAITVPIVFGLMHATPGHAQSQNDNTAPARFESFTITPSQPADSAPNPGEKQVTKMMFGPSKGFIAANVTLQTMIQDAYGMQANQIVGAPDWLNSERFDVEGKVSPSQKADGASSQPFTVRGPLAPIVADAAVVKQMMQAALADSTKLVVHTETRVLPNYVLVVAEGGSKLQPTPEEELSSFEGSNSQFGPRMVNGVRLKANEEGRVMDLQAHGMFVNDLAEHLARQLGQPVTNKTGLTGRYDFHLHFTKDTIQPGSTDATADSTSADSPSLLTAVQEQLGLKLEPQKGPTPVLVIDHIEQPATDQANNTAPAR